MVAQRRLRKRALDGPPAVVVNFELVFALIVSRVSYLAAGITYLAVFSINMRTRLRYPRRIARDLFLYFSVPFFSEYP